MFAARKPMGKSMVAKSGSENVEVEETLGALERARHFGNSKLSLQRLVFVSELVDCAHGIGYEATVSYILPIVKKLALDPEVQVRQALVGRFGDLAGFLIQSDPESGKAFSKVVDDLLPVVSGLLAEKASEVRQGAAEALITLASHLRASDLRRGDELQLQGQIWMEVIKLSHNNEDEEARSTAVQLLNGLAEAFGLNLCQQFVGVELRHLCEDPAIRVRKATAANFAEVSRVVGDDYVLRDLLPAFNKLVNDPNWSVRKAAAESLVGLTSALKVENREQPMLPLMNALLKDASKWVRVAALQQLGYFIASLESGERVPMALLNQYVEIIGQSKANPDVADISYHCAYTFAAVTRTLGTSLWTGLQAPFCALCKDAQAKTRRAMAASMHVIAEALGEKLTERDVMPYFEALLQDAAPEVRLAALRNVAPLLRVAPTIAPQRRIINALQCTLGKPENWRLRHLAASQLGAICEALSSLLDSNPLDSSPWDAGPTVADSSTGSSQKAGPCSDASSSQPEESSQAKDLTWQVIVPLFLQLCADPVAEVRDEAARVTAKALRAAAPEVFVELGSGGAVEGSSGCSSSIQPPLPPFVRDLIRMFARGRSFRCRMTYIRMCDSVIRELPPYVFTNLLLRPVVRLSNDPVKNVRLCFVSTLLPHIRKAGRLGQSRALIHAATRMGQKDEDAEVRRILTGVHFAELSDLEGDALAIDGDSEDSDKGEGWLATEGGTGDCSGSDAGVAEEPRKADVDEQPSSTLAATSSPRFETLSTSSSHCDERGANAVYADVPMSPVKPRSPLQKAAIGPNSPNGTPALDPSGAPAFDLVEDGLVDQSEMDRSLDPSLAALVAQAKESGEDLDSEHIVEEADTKGTSMPAFEIEEIGADTQASAALPD